MMLIMFSLYEKFIFPFIEKPEILAIPALLALLYHFFSSRRNSKQQLRQARIGVYSEFISEFSTQFCKPSFLRIDKKINRQKNFITKLVEISKNNWNSTKSHNTEDELVSSTKEEINEMTTRNEILKEAFDVARLFGRCRLVAGSKLESRLRDLHSNIANDLMEGGVVNFNKKEPLLGYEVEQYMRYDVGSINYFQLVYTRIIIFIRRIQQLKSTDETEGTRDVS